MPLDNNSLCNNIIDKFIKCTTEKLNTDEINTCKIINGFRYIKCLKHLSVKEKNDEK